MKVKVEPLFNSGFRLSFWNDGHHRREFIHRKDTGDSWDRSYSSQALNLLENVYHIDRSKIRFDVL